MNRNFFTGFTSRLIGGLFLFSIAAIPAFAKGTQEKDYQKAQGKDNFNEKIDLTHLKPGEYNLLVKTTDVAGNVSYVGPFNFYYDPKSDNPLSSIANPSPGQRVTGNFNVVGVATAPKGVAQVEVRLDGGEWTKAAGKSFWSYPFKAAGLPDGIHRLEVRGTDVHGVVGPLAQVSFSLDQLRPELSLTSAHSGDRVSGDVTLSGTLSDGNGLKSLEMSLDGQKTFQPISLEGDSRAPKRSFHTTFSTKKMADGPLIVWLHGVDGQGSEVRQAVLLYVDNTVPVITVLSPAAKQGLHGKVTFALEVEKTLGIKSLSARVGDKGKPVTIPVVAGNPFHVVTLDLPLSGTGTIPVIFDAIDTAGKLGTTTYLAVLNGDTDLPVVTLSPDIDKKTVHEPVVISGSLVADDGPSAVAWSLNTSPEVVQPAAQVFQIPLAGLVSGLNKLTLVGIDKDKRRGKPLVETFTAVLAPPTLHLTTVVRGTESLPFVPGILLSPVQGAHLQGTLVAPNPLKSLTWSLGGGPPLPVSVTTKAGTASFDLDLPPDPPFGITDVTITAADLYGQTTVARTFVDITNLSKGQGPDGLVFVDPRVGGSGPVVVTPETPLEAYFAGGLPQTVTLLTGKGTVPTSVLTVSSEGRIVTIRAAKDGQFSDVKVKVVTDKGREYITPLGTLMGDSAAPEIGLSSPEVGSWSKGTVQVEGKATDQNGIKSLEWTIDDGATWHALDPPSGKGGSFSRSIDLPGPDNAVNLLLRATDGAGRQAVYATVLRRDSQGPTIDMVLPPLTAETKGTVYAAGRFLDDGALKTAKATIAGKSYPLPIDRPFVLKLDAEAVGGKSIVVRVEDWAGNVTEQSYPVTVEPVSPPDPKNPLKPSIEILFPTPAMAGLFGKIPVVGRVTGFTAAPVLKTKGEAALNKPLELSDAGYFTFETDTSALKNRSLVLTAAGSEKESASLSYVIPYDAAAEKPQARFSLQSQIPVLTGHVTASGWLHDANGVVSWISQLDAQAPVTTAPDPQKAPAGTFLVDCGVPSPGKHRLTVTPVNAAGVHGVPAVTEFIASRVAGPIAFTNLTFGQDIDAKSSFKVEGTVPSVSPWKSFEVRFVDLNKPDSWEGPYQSVSLRSGTKNVWSFTIPLPSNLPYSRIGISVRGTNEAGQLVETRSLFHRIWAKAAAAVHDTEGIVFDDTRYQAQSGRVEILPGEPLFGVFRGRPIESLALSPEVPGVKLTKEGSVLSLDAAAEGLFGPFEIVVTTVDHEVFKTPPMTLFADKSGPQLDLKSPLDADWIKGTVTFKGTVTDPSGVASLEFSTDQGATWTSLSLKDNAFEASSAITAPDGLVRLLVRAKDKGGHETQVQRIVSKDTTAPIWTLIAPPASRLVNGLTTIIGQLSDANPVDKVEFSDNGKTFKPAEFTNLFSFDLDFASYTKLPEFSVKTTDVTGNSAVAPLKVPLDQDADKPKVQIQTPVDGQVVSSDFVVGGMAFDDDGIKSLSWRLDGGPWQKREGETSFQIPFKLDSLTDNEHTIEIQAEDIYGTKGDVAKSTFRVSLASPEAVLFSPRLDTTVSGVVELYGASFDRNGIDGVQISLDNGLTWYQASLRDKEDELRTSKIALAEAYHTKERKEWSWKFESKTLKDGTYLVMVKSTDHYGVEALFTTLVNIDNTPPTLTLTSPSDGQSLLDTLSLQGRSQDNIKLVSLQAELRPIPSPDEKAPSKNASPAAVHVDLPVTPTFNVSTSLANLPLGWYNLRLEGKDQAGNSTYVARNVLIEGASADTVQLLYPQQGETESGKFLLEGKVSSRSKVETAIIIMDGTSQTTAAVDERGYFSAAFDSATLDSGTHTFTVTAQPAVGPALKSEPRNVVYDKFGPWLQVSSQKSGSYVTQRPWISGTAGWNPAPLAQGATPTQIKDYKKALEGHRLVRVEGSLDNGKTWGPADGTDKWKFRLETLPLPDGPLPLVFLAHFKDGSVAVQRILVTVAQTPPNLSLITPVENGRFNGSLDLAGFSDGKSQVKAVEIAVRQGDKSGYEVPQFIQGMYVDTHFLGATTWEAGLGFTFFQEAVKLQAQIGETPQFLANGQEERFYGTVLGAKLIANILQLPGSYYFGPDWAWLSSSFGLGANFENYSMKGSFGDFNLGSGVVLGGVVFQWEMVRAAVKNWPLLKSYAWYTEATVWFISSDVQAQTYWTFSTGLRFGLF